MQATQRGFTLIELMTVIVVVAILASIAVPSYRNYLLRAQRTEATTALLNLQAAQDLIQTQGVFYSRSEDATGAGRMQILDRDWVVVDQQPAAGEPIGEGDALLYVKKIGE